jgi:predicted PurR-regulated permease PerM
MHTLLIFFALLGGVEAFGVMGLFIGPVVLSVTLVLLEMLRETNLEYIAARQPRTVKPAAGKGEAEHYVS